METPSIERWVDIAFTCLPLRLVGDEPAPADASPKYAQLVVRSQDAKKRHGQLNTYYLYNARCVYHLVNHEQDGLLEFRFEGTVLTDGNDQQTVGSDLSIELVRETCDWLQSPIVQWFTQTVDRAVQVEFNRYIAVGDLQKTIDRVERLRAETEAAGGYVGMYL